MNPIAPVMSPDFEAFFRTNLESTVRSVEPIVGVAAEDVAQEAFMAALARWDSVAGLDYPAGWVRFVARRIALRRRYRDQIRPQLEERSGGHVGSALDEAIGVDLATTMRHLPSQQRAAIELHYLADQPVNEVAHLLDASEAAVKVWLYRARERLGGLLLGHSGTWVSEQRWNTDALVARMRATDDADFAETVIGELTTPPPHRWVFTLHEGKYEISSNGEDLLDYGRYRVRGRTLVLVPWNKSGVVVLGPSVDADHARFRVIEDTTAPTSGVPDDVYLRLLLEADIFVWKKAAEVEVGTRL